MEPVTLKENVKRGEAGKLNNHQKQKTHCPKGHEYTKTNNKGKRICRTCANEQTRLYYKRQKEQHQWKGDAVIMTRKDYVAVSNILSDYQEVMDLDEYFTMCLDFAKYMAQDNERFDTRRFLEACGINVAGIYSNPVGAGEHVSLRWYMPLGVWGAGQPFCSN